MQSRHCRWSSLGCWPADQAGARRRSSSPPITRRIAAAGPTRAASCGARAPRSRGWGRRSTPSAAIALTAHDPHLDDVAGSSPGGVRPCRPDRLRGRVPTRSDVRRLSTAAPTPRRRRGGQTAVATKRADDLPHSTWLPAADQRAATVRRPDRRTAPDPRPCVAGPRSLLPPMLGGSGHPPLSAGHFRPMRKSRGLGGLPGVFFAVVVRARNGKGRLRALRPNGHQHDPGHAHVDLGRDFERWYASLGVEAHVSVNSTASPDMASERRASGCRCGATRPASSSTAPSPPTRWRLSYLLNVTGPAHPRRRHGGCRATRWCGWRKSEAIRAIFEALRRAKRFLRRTSAGRRPTTFPARLPVATATALLDALERAADERRLLRVVRTPGRGGAARPRPRSAGCCPRGPAPPLAALVVNQRRRQASSTTTSTALSPTSRGTCSAGRRSTDADGDACTTPAPPHGLAPYVRHSQ